MNPPRDLDDASLRRIARTFYTVRMVRYAVLVAFAVLFAAVGLHRGHPAVAVALAALVALMVLGALMTWRRYVRSQRAPGPSSGPSPTA